MEENAQIKRFFPSDQDGLTTQQVEQRREQGLANGESEIKTKSIGQIIRGNIITPFNILNFILAALVLAVGSYRNLLFMGVILCNILIGTFQEIRAKKTIDRLSLIAAPKAHVVRDRQVVSVAVNELVLDDILSLSAGNQICADCIVTSGECEVNESLLTGESDPVTKHAGDSMMSGSFIVSGACFARVEHVGKDNYASKISNSAKYLKKPNSEIMKWINFLIKWIGIALIPIGLMLFYKQIFISGQPFDQAIVSTVAALIGMIPEGLVLLTSVVLAVSVIRLSRHKTLVQELYCIETLARVDTLCLDKTGTITEGKMQVDELVPLNGLAKTECQQILSSLCASLNDSNPTFLALKEQYGTNCSWNCTKVVPFSSARKWSGAQFDGQGTYMIGATEFILLPEQAAPFRSQLEQASSSGQRVLLLAFSRNPFSGKELPAQIEPLALILLSDKIRPEARKTLRYFADQGVDLKVISGDNAITVANIAKKAGLEQADLFVDATTLKSEDDIKQAAGKYAVFGRVTPEQKLQLVKALKENNHIVAMTGDGVNDVMALKEADCSIAMASGSDAARTVSQLVLLDSNFASMPKVVHEGRRSINNLQRSASLFLVKAFFSAMIAVLFIFIPLAYPFQPIQFTLMNAFAIGIPSFILALEPNKDRIRGSFIVNIIKKSLPGAFTMTINIVMLAIISSFLGFSHEQISTLAVLLTGFTGMVVLLSVCLPFNKLRLALFCTMVLGFTVAILCFQPLFYLVELTIPMVLVLFPLFLLAFFLFGTLQHLVERILLRHVDD